MNSKKHKVKKLKEEKTCWFNMLVNMVGIITLLIKKSN